MEKGKIMLNNGQVSDKLAVPPIMPTTEPLMGIKNDTRPAPYTGIADKFNYGGSTDA